MKKIIYSVLLFSVVSNAQVQMGNDIDGISSENESGTAISISSNGNILAISSPFSDVGVSDSGQVKVYTFISGNWVQLGNDINGLNSDDNFGSSFSLSSDGNILAIGAPNFNGSGNDIGQVRVFTLSDGNWIQLGNDINGTEDNHFLGASVSLSADGNILSIGAPGFDIGSNDGGQVRVFNFISGNWVQLGNDINGDVSDTFFGNDITLSSDGNILAISDFNYDQNAVNTGKVKVFSYSGGNWTQLGNTINGQLSEDDFKHSISFNTLGNLLAIGIPGNDENGNNSGKVRVYSFSSGNWNQYGNDINNNVTESLFGFSVKLSPNDNSLIIGSPGHNSNSGKTSIYTYNTGNWEQIGSDIIGEASDDFSGISLSLSNNNILAIGGAYNDGNGIDSGHVRVYDLSGVLTSNSLELQNIDLYPNPAKSKLYINSNQKIELYNVEIFSFLGQLLKTQSINNNSSIIDLSSLSKGVYFVKIISNEGNLVKKIIVE